MMTAFRETLWFKRGELTGPVGEEAPVPLPIEDRYVDDGSVFASDSLQFGLHTGETCKLPQDLPPVVQVVSVDNSELRALARELKKHRRMKAVAIVGGSLIAIAAAVLGQL
jgi:hypothetical protein